MPRASSPATVQPSAWPQIVPTLRKIPGGTINWDGWARLNVVLYYHDHEVSWTASARRRQKASDTFVALRFRGNPWVRLCRVRELPCNYLDSELHWQINRAKTLLRMKRGWQKWRLGKKGIVHTTMLVDTGSSYTIIPLGIFDMFQLSVMLQ